MSDFLQTLSVSASGMRAQSERLKHVAENVANADTPGYHRKSMSFEAYAPNDPSDGRVKAGPLQLDRSELNRIYDPSNPLSDDQGFYDGSNVNTLLEIADSREAQRGYEANLKMFDQARQMSRSLLDLLRR
ncbi:MAG: flagellar basal body rod protein FlgC [Qingshengfaniella sp.]